MGDELVDLEIRFVLLKHGQRKVLESLSRIRNTSVRDIEVELEKIERRKRTKPTIRHRTAAELIDDLHISDERSEALVKDLAHKFEAKLFLSTLKEVDLFLRHNGSEKKAKTRNAALPTVLRILAGLSAPELKELVADTLSVSDQSVYYSLAHEIMGKAAEH